MKDIKNLQKDIYHVLNTGEGYTKEIADWVGEQVSLSTQRQLIDKRTGKSYLRMSNMGTPCERKLWYSIQNFSDSMKEQLQPYVKNKFIYGDVIECWALGLVKAAGYKLEGMQDVVEINGVKGSRDCVIEGTTFDVKSASTFGMDKFKDNGLLKDDPFAYLSQLSSYVYAAKDDPIVTDKKHGAFLVFEKQHGHVVVDIYDLTPWLEEKEAEVLRKKSVVASKKEPQRGFEDVPDGKSGNRKLGTYCSYCVDPESKILMGDLTWKKAKYVSTNEVIWGFDRDTSKTGRGRTRCYRKGTVNSVSTLHLKKYKVVTTKGETIVSEGHKFLTRTKKGNLPDFRTVEQLNSNHQIYWFETPWDTEQTLDKSYLAGFLDGEGCYSNGYLSWAQKPGQVSTKVLTSMEALGYENNQRYTKGVGDCETFRVYGGFKKSVRAVGEIRPVRLLPKAIEDLEGKQVSSNIQEYADVISVEYIGYGEVIAIETSIKTYINDGFLSHNCDYKFQCYPDLSKYVYSNGPRYLTVVEREPNVFKET